MLLQKNGKTDCSIELIFPEMRWPSCYAGTLSNSATEIPTAGGATRCSAPPGPRVQPLPPPPIIIFIHSPPTQVLFPHI